jgi:hypothetical protein
MLPIWTQLRPPWFARFQHDNTNKKPSSIIRLIWLVSLAQVWTCYTINLFFQIQFVWFKGSLNENNYSIPIYPPTLSLKITKSPSRNSFVEGFPIISKVFPNFPKLFYFVLFNFLWQNYSIFNHSCNIGLNVTKPPQFTPTFQVFEGFPTISRAQWGLPWFTNKTNKLPSSI